MMANCKKQIANFYQRRDGFTLIETIIYLAIVSIILVSISYLIIDIIAGQTKSYANSEVNQNSRFITNILSKDIRAAKDISSLTSDTLVLTTSGSDITYNFDSENEIITRLVGSETPITLNSNRTEVTGSFSDLSYLDRAKNVGIYLEINHKNPSNLPDYEANINNTFAVELRGRR